MTPSSVRSVVLLLSVVMVIVRFASPSAVFFHHDEGLLFNHVDQHYLAGTWPRFGLEGTKGLHYGPVPLSIYLAIRHLLPSAESLPTAAFYVNAILHLASLLYFVTCVRRWITGTPFWLFVGLVFTAPYLTFYSRLLWDNTFLIVFSNIIAGLLLSRFARVEPGKAVLDLKAWMALGALSALCFGTHLMSAPLIASAGIVAVLGPGSLRSKIHGCLIYSATFLVLTAPYLFYLAGLEQVVSPGEEARRFTQIFTGTRDVLFRWSGWVSWAEFGRDLIGPNYSEVYRRDLFGGLVLSSLIEVARVLQILWIVAIVGVPVWLLKSKHRITKPAAYALGAVLTLLVGLHFGMSLIKDATTHTHYLQSVWWTPFLLVALGLQQCQAVAMRTFQWLSSACLALAFLNAAVSLSFGARVLMSKGFEGRGLGPGIGLQQQAVSEVCSRALPGAEIAFESTGNDIAMSNIDWHARHSRACLGRDIQAASTGRRYVFRYTHAGMDILTLE